MKTIVKKSLPFLLVLLVIGGLVFTLVQSYTPKTPLFSELTADEYGRWETADEFAQDSSMLGIAPMKTAAEKDDTALLYNEKTAELAVKTPEGIIWYTSPQNRLSLNSAGLDRYSSTVLVKTVDKAGAAGEFTSFGDSVKYGQFTAATLPDGLSVTYRLGKAAKISPIPKAMPKERFESILESLSSLEQKTIKTYYGYANYEGEKDSAIRQNLESKYTNIAKLKAIYTLKASMSAIETKKLEEYLSKASYTIEHKTEDHEAVGLKEEESGKPHVLLTVEYTLQNGKLAAKARISEMKVTKDLSVTGVVLLPFLTTANAENIQAVVPDGSGALADLSAIRQPLTPEYLEPVYGPDYALPQAGKAANKAVVSLPCYGMTNNDGGFLATLQKASATAELYIKARSGQDEIGQVSFLCKTLDQTSVKLSETDTQSVNMYPDFAYTDDAALEITFLPKEKNTYSDIAAAYKEALALPQKNGDKPLLFAELVGAIDSVEPFLGVPKEVIKPLTSFEQAGEILDWLTGNVSDAKLIASYAGMTKGGMKASKPARLNPESKLGGAKGYNSLLEKTSALGVEIYPQIDFEYAYRSAFGLKNRTAKLLTGELSVKTKNNPANYTADEDSFFGYTLKPGQSLDTVTKFLSAKNNLEGRIGVSAMAGDLSSDFQVREGLNRNKAVEYTTQKLAALQENGLSILSLGANAYALPYLTYSVNLPCDSNKHPVLTRSVPFVQMVLSGSVSYSMPLLNSFADPDYYALKAIETGSAVYFQTAAAPSSEVKGTPYDHLYNIHFDVIKNRVSETSRKVTEALKDVTGSSITRHTMLAEGVFKTDYDNGRYVIVNYNRDDVQTDFGLVKGWSYI